MYGGRLRASPIILMYSILPTINKEWILERVSQEEIMVRYTGQPIVINAKFHSPFREDNSPSCVYYYNKQGKLLFRDFGKGRPMDAFEVACTVLRCDFTEVLKRLTDEFNLLRVERKPAVDDTLELAKKLANEPTTITIEPYTLNGSWDMDDAGQKFWHKYGVTPKTLKKYKVFQLNQAWCNEKPIYRYVATSPGFAYWFGGNDYKLYFPLKDKVRFLCNTDVVQGESQLPKGGKHLIITKSLKDVMVFAEYGVPAIAPQSEVHPLTYDYVDDLKQRFGKITLVYDYDYTGVKNTNKMRKQFDINYAFVEGAKDISDLQVSSPYHAQQWVNKLMNG